MTKLMPVLLFLLTVLSRLPFTSKYLYHMDSGHFALALQDYNLVTHQPHPPGYFLYIMLGRLIHLFIPEANTVFVLISILFSGFTVVAVYCLGREMYDEKTGKVAALLTLVSPNLWFHGEVALTYSAEAFFSALLGLFCWRLLQGKKEYLWLATAALALAGGFRQSGAVFLFPLWLFAVRRESLPRICAALAVGGLIVLGWFIPMTVLTGGFEAYLAAFRELWLYNTGHNSVFEKGFIRLIQYAGTLNAFLFSTLGAALPVCILACYTIARTGRLSLLRRPETAFMACWTLPSLLFYLLIFIHSSNPGYVLIMLPPLMQASSAALFFLGGEMKRLTGRTITAALVCFVLLLNIGIFLMMPIQTSRSEITAHDRNTAAMLAELSAFNPETTALFVYPYSFYSYRHIMLYLPEFLVYQVDVRVSESGKYRMQFAGTNRKTFLDDKIRPPGKIASFAAVVIEDPGRFPAIRPPLSVKGINRDIRIVSGPIEGVLALYPELGPVWQHAEADMVRHPLNGHKE